MLLSASFLACQLLACFSLSLASAYYSLLQLASARLRLVHLSASCSLFQLACVLASARFSNSRFLQVAGSLPSRLASALCACLRLLASACCLLVSQLQLACLSLLACLLVSCFSQLQPAPACFTLLAPSSLLTSACNSLLQLAPALPRCGLPAPAGLFSLLACPALLQPACFSLLASVR